MPAARGTRTRLGSAIVVALLCAAPVPGDIGACGQPVERLDAPRFFTAKRNIDCNHCSSCGLQSKACTVACGTGPLPLTQFPVGCVPLIHDGEVCLRKLLESSCDDYARFIDDNSPTVPSECDFCPSEP
ncbi:MAG TPA: hypothetical protein VH062_12440 [Polyangiaceae bacterium]|jgi:hypothetical protein|nr:hypothetical protein [Polyangiaceae bacterium]